jgi:hypothetical protein
MSLRHARPTHWLAKGLARDEIRMLADGLASSCADVRRRQAKVGPAALEARCAGMPSYFALTRILRERDPAVS